MSDRVFQFKASSSQPQRLDKFLVESMPDYSRSYLQGLIRDGFAQVNATQVFKTGFFVEAGDLVELRVPPQEQAGLKPEPIPLDIIFENDDVIIVNKPAGMVVHPAAGHSSGTLVHAVLAHIPDLEDNGEEQRPGVIHRLDKDTSGLILLAKNKRARQEIQNQFKTRRVKKVYIALVEGRPPTPEGRIEAEIGRDPVKRKRMSVVMDGKGRKAITEYFTEEDFSEHTLLRVHPLTGRTHQIRVHLAFLGCPVVGDRLYGRRRVSVDLDRQFLHAAQLTLQLPGEEKDRMFSAPLPAELKKVLAYLRQR